MPDSAPLTRYKAIIEYDGTRYLGFQRQIEKQITVQGELERGLSRIAGCFVLVLAAGRTDSGVHARGQVVSFDLVWRHGSDSLKNALNANLPPDIKVLGVDAVSADFHPRFDARRRAYRYTIYNAPYPCRPLYRLYSWHVSRHLDVARMNQAAETLIGQYDFATFGQPPQGTNTVREVFQANWHCENHFLIFDIVATAFLKRMVRSLVGSFKLVGDGSWSVTDFVAAFHAKERSLSGPAAPPQGLVLESVCYKAHQEPCLENSL